MVIGGWSTKYEDMYVYTRSVWIRELKETDGKRDRGSGIRTIRW